MQMHRTRPEVLAEVLREMGIAEDGEGLPEEGND
jgi:hypothetical protein